MKSYKDLDIYKEATDYFFRIHEASLLLPKHEMYELGSQIRRSTDSVGTNIVEGYGRRRYKAEFVRFLVFSHASCLESIYHLEKLQRLYPDTAPWSDLHDQYDTLAARIYRFIEYVEKNWKT